MARLLLALLRQRRILVAVPAACVLLTVAVSLLLPRDYSTRVAFMPSSSDLPASQLSGLAAQFGVSVPGERPGNSPGFYADLIRTTAMLRSVVETNYTLADQVPPRTGTLIELFAIQARTPERALNQAIKDIRADVLTIKPNVETGVVHFDVTTRAPELSEQIARRLLALIDDFNRHTRQSEAEAERLFIAERLTSARAELREAENALERFLERNREFRADPRLVFEYERMQRTVLMRQELFTTLASGYERARIDAVRNTPSITLVEPPMRALQPDSRGLLVRSFLGAVFGLMFVVAAMLAGEVFKDGLRNDATVRADLAQLRRDLLHDLRRPWRLLGIGRSAS